jgi:hypothetical protein
MRMPPLIAPHMISVIATIVGIGCLVSVVIVLLKLNKALNIWLEQNKK